MVKHVYPDTSMMMVIHNKDDLMVRLVAKDIYPEDRLILYGNYKQNYHWGRYFDVLFYREVFDELWVAKWLKLTKQLRDDEIVDLIVEKKEIAMYKEELRDIFRVEKMFHFLLTQGVSEQTVAFIEQDYRYRFVSLIQNPYQLLKYPQITFGLVEQVIEKYALQNPLEARAEYLMEHFLNKANQSGHYFLPKDEMEKRLKKYAVSFDEVKAILPSSEKFYFQEDSVYLKQHYKTETWIAQNIAQRIAQPKETVDSSVVEVWEEETGFTLAKNQKEGVKMALQEKFCIVTGGPGVGKTTVCKCITDLLGKTYSILMVAPTGRAAKRANESTGLNTSTVHSLLGYNGQDFHRNKDNPVETDVLVIDESSMIDAPLLAALLDAIPMYTKIIFVGDVDQLPSVGPGQILKDLIDSGNVPVTRLTEIFRQAADSPIITLAYAVNRGELPELQNHEDLLYIEKEKEEDLFLETVNIAEKLYKEHDLFDVQVLIPMYKGPVGIDAVNRELQKRLNPHSPSVKVGDFEIREKDKVIQTRNVKEKGIYNGDVGVVTKATPYKITVHFQGSDHETEFSPEEFWDLQLSYAVTVHRSQGSEYRFVVIPTVNSYGVMLQKNLLYTAITRSKKKLWMLYQGEALKKAIRLDSVPERYTTLKELLKNKSA